MYEYYFYISSTLLMLALAIIGTVKTKLTMLLWPGVITHSFIIYISARILSSSHPDEMVTAGFVWFNNLVVFFYILTGILTVIYNYKHRQVEQ